MKQKFSDKFSSAYAIVDAISLSRLPNYKQTIRDKTRSDSIYWDYFSYVGTWVKRDSTPILSEIWGLITDVDTRKGMNNNYRYCVEYSPRQEPFHAKHSVLPECDFTISRDFRGGELQTKAIDGEIVYVLNDPQKFSEYSEKGE